MKKETNLVYLILLLVCIGVFVVRSIIQSNSVDWIELRLDGETSESDTRVGYLLRADDSGRISNLSLFIEAKVNRGQTPVWERFYTISGAVAELSEGSSVYDIQNIFNTAACTGDECKRKTLVMNVCAGSEMGDVCDISPDSPVVKKITRLISVVIESQRQGNVSQDLAKIGDITREVVATLSDPNITWSSSGSL